MIEPIALRRLVGTNIRTLRKACGWSQERLGEQANLSYKFIGEVERGAVNPSLDSLAGIAGALNVDIGKLFLKHTQIIVTDDDLASARNALSVLHQVLSPTGLRSP